MSEQESAGPTSRVYFSQRLRLHYVDWGNGGAPPLVLLHGGQDHCRNWDWVAQRLRHEWHIIAPDLRGHGDSQWSATGSYTMAGYIYDLTQLIDQQRLAPVTLIGHSLGGNIALRYTGLYPETVKKLVAIEGLGPSPKLLAERKTKTVDERLRKWVELTRSLAGRVPRRLRRQVLVLRHLRALLAVQCGASLRRSARHRYAACLDGAARSRDVGGAAGLSAPRIGPAMPAKAGI